ncbi:MAG: polyketide cyclase [Methylobacter sp.]|nr:MAG: polyketide cyclase [Methylobacter sp.]
MQPITEFNINPERDLTFERMVELPPELIWAAWTRPELIVRWFTPEPWKTVACELELKPGGKFQTVMRSPEGQEFPHQGCYLEIAENRQLVWTNAMEPGFRPAKPPQTTEAEGCGGFFFTAGIQLTPVPQGTLYRALVMHYDKASCDAHAAMGFEEGWGKALDQLIAMVKAGI